MYVYCDYDMMNYSVLLLDTYMYRAKLYEGLTATATSYTVC